MRGVVLLYKVKKKDMILGVEKNLRLEKQMKKKLFKIIFGMIIGMLLFACNKKADNFENTIITSNYPMYAFTKLIVGDNLNVINIIPPGVEPHDWEPSVKNIADLEKAEVFVYNGAGMEPWTNKILSSLENKNLYSVEASNGVDLIKINESHSGHHHDGFDPHVFLSLRAAQIELTNIKNALEKIRPENKEIFEKNYKKAIAEFKNLDEEYIEKLAPYKGKNIVVAHEAFAYLCRDYNLNQVGIENVFSDSEPSPAKMKEIIEFIKAEKIKTIFCENLASPKIAKAIAKETGVRIDTLNPLEGLTEEEIKAGENYLSIMKKNLRALEKALKEN